MCSTRASIAQQLKASCDQEDKLLGLIEPCSRVYVDCIGDVLS